MATEFVYFDVPSSHMKMVSDLRIIHMTFLDPGWELTISFSIASSFFPMNDYSTVSNDIRLSNRPSLPLWSTSGHEDEHDMFPRCPSREPALEFTLEKWSNKYPSRVLLFFLHQNSFLIRLSSSKIIARIYFEHVPHRILYIKNNALKVKIVTTQCKHKLVNK